MNIELLLFQRDAISQIQNAIENGRRSIILKSCTGSGKTIILTHFMSEYLKTHVNTVFVWFTPGKGNLEEQSKRKMDLYIHGAHTKLLSDVMTGGFSDGDCCFINWELLNKDKNNARKDGERTNFDEWIIKAHESGLHFILVIDESHASDTKKTKDIVYLFHAEAIIRASATPNDYDKKADYLVEVSEEDVIEQGLIKKLLVLNEGFGSLADTIVQENQIDFLLSRALKKQQLLHKKFLEQGTNINPLILVQMPNTSDALLQSVQEWFEKQKITVENGLLAIWLSDKGKKDGVKNMHENLDGIEANNAIPIAMIFKMAVATGWDCPRAHILVKLRENMGEKFEIQTFGRIRRMPQACHYGDDDLDSCYLYTFDEKFLEGAKKELGKGALDASLLHLKSEYEDFELLSEKKPDISEENDGVRAYKSAIKQFSNAYGLEKNSKANKLKLENAGYIFNLDIINSAKYGSIHLTSQVKDFKDVDFRIPLNTHIHGREYHHMVGIISTDISLIYDKVNAIIRRLFSETVGITTGKNPTIKKSPGIFLNLNVRELYAFVINNIELLRHDFKTAMTAQTIQSSLGLNSGAVVKKTFRFPRECLFTYNSHEMSQKIFSKNVYENYLESAEIRSSSERAFEKYCQENKDIIWFYKNGDKGSEYYSIIYEDNNGKQRTFYPDYVVNTTKGLWIIETKGGEKRSGESEDVDKFSQKKFEALKSYISQFKKTNPDLHFGFVRQNAQKYLCICTENYSENIERPNWDLLEEVF